jgi:hypothetical protein
VAGELVPEGDQVQVQVLEEAVLPPEGLRV